MKTIKDIEFLEGVKVLVRADFNVSVINGKVVDDFRIRATLPTIEYLRSKGAKIILMSHLESIDGGNGSLKPVAENLNTLGVPVLFIQSMRGAHEFIEAHVKDGDCVLLENLRFNEGEKTNDANFAKGLASMADIYVNDAFPVCHRKHASVVGLPKLLPSYAGLRLESEVEHLSKSFNPKHPFLFMLGGAKFETKMPLVHKFINSADKIFIGGALANDFFKKKGYEVGRSLLSKGDIGLDGLVNNPKIIIPIDILNESNEVRSANGVLKTDKIMDSGPKTEEILHEEISKASFILWNGPLGVYEDGYKGATLNLAKMVSEATGRGVETVVGGGDTLAAIDTLGIGDKFTFISTGGGAMLDFLANGSLPGIEALK